MNNCKYYRVKSLRGLGLFFFLAFFSCRNEMVPDLFQPRSDHEAYLHKLEKAGLLENAIGRDWKHSSVTCLNQAILMDTPFEESIYFDPAAAEAISYRFEAKRGQKIQMDLDMIQSDSFILFADLFRVNEEVPETFVHVASANKKLHLLAFEPLKDATYIIRIQPELLRGGKCTVTIRKVPAFEFPVVGKGKEDIWSLFGDPRDGGRRKHHGVDIFAKRHTAIIAPIDGYVRFTGERGLGGKQVWLRDRQRDMSLYFAHLEDILVDDNTFVEVGDTLGTVGNSGNARTTRPHLHFGIYQNGPIDPYHFIVPIRKKIQPPKGDIAHLGTFLRTKRSTNLQTSPKSTSVEPLNLSKDHLLKAKGMAGQFFRVELQNGIQGYVPVQHVESSAPPQIFY